MDAATLVLEPLKRASTSSSRHTDDGSSPADAVAVDGSRCVLGRAGGDSVVAGVTTLNVSREQVALERCEGGWRATQRGMNPSCVITDDGVHVLRRGESRLLQDGDDVVLDGNSLMGRVRKQGGFCDGFRVRTRAPEPASLLAAKDAEIRELKRKLEEAARQPRAHGHPAQRDAAARRGRPGRGRRRRGRVGRGAAPRGRDRRRPPAVARGATGLAPPFKVIFRQRVLDDDAATLEGVGLVEDAAVVVVAAPFKVRARIVGGAEVAVDAQRTHAVAALKAAIAGAAALTDPFTVIFRQRPLADDAATLADEGFGGADVVVVARASASALPLRGDERRGKLVEDLGGSVDCAVSGDRYDAARIGRDRGGCGVSRRTTRVIVSDDEARRQLRCRDGGPGRRRELLAYLGFDPAGGDAGDRLWFVSQGWAHASRGGRADLCADERDFLATPGLAPSALPEPVAADAPPPAAAPAEGLGGAPPSDRAPSSSSRGAESPYVDQDRPLALGGHAPGRLRHVWVVVVDPEELEAYASRHPDALFLALPRAGRAVGYARSVAQRVCSVGATACGFYWSVDDNVVRFQKWNLPDAAEYAEIGFLRQRGTAVCVRQAHATNVLSVYKCLLLNNGLLRSKSVAYNPVLSRFEDIALSHAAVAAGLKTLNGSRRRRSTSATPTRRLDDAADCGFWGAAGRRHVLRVATYAFATRHAARLRGLFDRVVFDEAHCLRNEKTRRHAALLDVARHAPVVHCLTGTPVVNASTDVLSLFRVLGYGGPRPGRAALRGLSARLMLRRRRCDPAPDGGPLVRLPEKREEDVVVPFATARERRRYDRLLDDARRELTRERADAGAARAAALVYLQKLCLACLFDADDVAGEEERALVFSRFASFLRAAEAAAAAAGLRTLRIDGAVSLAARQAACERFQRRDARGNVALFITIGAGGEGLNLTAADAVVLCEPYWNEPVEDQAVARAHRIGRARPLDVVRLHIEKTVEVPIAKLKRDKAADAARFLDADDDDDGAADRRAKSRSLSIAQLRVLFDLDDAMDESPDPVASLESAASA
ncbi:hypothetical protein JL720_4086 [Aureococcus anophagefferens]|nr:hypothetical protein JL720_4086 [Aureococcus anophagefferens]